MANNESKHDKFVRIAESRTNKIVNMIRLLGNCANKNTYDYEKADIDNIFIYIEKEIKSCKSKFEESNNKETTFKLR